MRPSDYDDGLDADGVPTDDGAWRMPYRRGDERYHGEAAPEPIDTFFPAILERAEIFAKIRDVTDSPIEDILGAALLMAARAAGVNMKLCKGRPGPFWDGYALVPQCRWGMYRSDWAIISHATKMALLIECDGKEFHSSPERIEHDRKKDQAAHDRGYLTMRFTGAEINSDADGIAKRIVAVLIGESN